MGSRNGPYVRVDEVDAQLVAMKFIIMGLGGVVCVQKCGGEGHP